MANDTLSKYTKNYSPFVKVSKTVDGDIFEQDFYTIVKGPDYDSGIQIRGTNFKVLVDNSRSVSKKYNNRRVRVLGYTTPECGDESKVSLLRTPLLSKTHAITDYAYYGSAVELIKASVTDIVNRFPGAIFWPSKNSNSFTIDGEEYLEISNEFEIDCWTKTTEDSDNIRHLNSNKDKYNFYKAGGVHYDKKELIVKKNGEVINVTPKSFCPDTIIGQTNMCCFSNGEEYIRQWWPYIYCDEEMKIHLLVKKQILETAPINRYGRMLLEPKDEIKAEFWDSLNEFEKILLNRSTKPLYRADFEYLDNDENGFFKEIKAYSWPTVNKSYSIDVSSGNFGMYLSNLIDMASNYDEYDSDCIWRMLVHESIKNLDTTVISRNLNKEDFDLDNTRMRAMLNVFGRSFDDIIVDINKIKDLKTVSYNDSDEIKLNDLKEMLDERGWSHNNVSPSYDIFKSGSTEYIVSSTTFYSGAPISFLPSMANKEFMKRLILNSKYINSEKGTRNAIKAVLNLFGYECDDTSEYTTEAGKYNINEYICIVDDYANAGDFAELRIKFESTDYLDRLTDGYPLALIEKENPNDNYLIPWVTPNTEYDNNMYFQSKGGWGHIDRKTVYINNDRIDVSGITMYRETTPRLYFAKDLNDLGELGYHNDLTIDDVCYVEDISRLVSNGPSHYFILKDTKNYTKVGEDGWLNVPQSEIDTCSSKDGAKVIYVESILATNEGNNPHGGNNQYDDGESYLDNFEHLFAKTKKTSCLSDTEIEQLDNFGFSLKESYDYLSSTKPMPSEFFIDNKKCHYFDQKETTYPEDERPLFNDDFYDDLSLPAGEQQDIVDSSKAKRTIIGANSAINVKNLVINFGTKPDNNSDGNNYLRDYIENVVIEYLEAVIPSTTIVKYTFNGEFKDNTSSQTLAGSRYRSFGSAGQAIVTNDDMITYEGNIITLNGE